MSAELALQQYRKKHDINVLPEADKGDGSIGTIKSSFADSQALLANYLQRYTEEHPKVIELRAQIESLRNKIHGLEDVSLGTKTSEYKALEGEVLTNKRMYDALLARMKEIDLSSTLTVNNISIIDNFPFPYCRFQIFYYIFYCYAIHYQRIPMIFMIFHFIIYSLTRDVFNNYNIGYPKA